jgi:hypothetical protein
MISKVDAIRSLVPGAEVVIYEDEIVWHVPSKAPVTDEQIEAEMVRLQSQESVDKQNAETAKQSGMAKLAAIGLTPEEIKSLLGA